MKYLAIFFATLLAANAHQALAGGSAKYSVTFDGTWSAATHPMEYPSGAHFSGLIGATHNGGYAVFKDKGAATDGLERLAEMGAHSPLDAEIRKAVADGKAGALLESGPIFGPPGMSSITFEIDDKHPMVSLVAMIAPSPDWFTGAANVNLMEGGNWVGEKSVTVYAWDAGTDSGTTYKAGDADMAPRGPVVANGSKHFMKDGKPVAVGTLTFKKM
ncbi:MAG: spondin domain-containing protein [Alphaproteobacteria bacterium]